MAESAEQGSARRAFLIHLAAWVVVNAALAAWNLTQTPPEGQPHAYWFQWPLLGWGIGVAAHGLALWLKRLGRGGGFLEDSDVRGAAVHLFVYLAVNALLIAVNVINSPTNLWFFWPLIGWGAGLGIHAWLVYRAVLKRTVEHYALEQRLIGEISLERRAAGIEAAAIPALLPEEAPAAQAKPKRKRPPARKKIAAKSKSAGKPKTAAKPKAPAAKKPAAGKGASAGTRAPKPKKLAARRKSGGPAASKSAGAS